MKRERVYLKVPFAEKEEAKRLGARWDQDSKRWFVPGERDLTPFAKWRQQTGYGPYKSPGARTLTQGQVSEDVNSLVDRARQVIRVRHMSRFTEKGYIGWILRFIEFHGGKHPGTLSSQSVSAFLSFLADSENVAASTQNQALNALVFLYREVLQIDLGKLEGIRWVTSVRAGTPSPPHGTFVYAPHGRELEGENPLRENHLLVDYTTGGNR